MPSTTANLIGITGYAGHGKDTIGSILVEQYGFKRMAFADKVRELALAINPIVYADNDICVAVQSLVNDGGWEHAKKSREVRRYLQAIGEGARQVFGADVWSDAVFSAIDATPCQRCVITDVRYPNEALGIQARGGDVWRVTRPHYDNGVGTKHPSEQYIATLYADAEIVNDGTVDDLAAKVAKLMRGGA